MALLRVVLGRFSILVAALLAAIFIPGQLRAFEETAAFENVTIDASDPEAVAVGYDLYSTVPRLRVRLLISNDGGNTFPYEATSTEGDAGLGVPAGTGRHIVWNAQADFPGVLWDRAVIRLIGNTVTSAYTVLETSSPGDGERCVAFTRETILSFSTPIDATTVTASSVKILQGGVAIPARYRVSADGHRVSAFPATHLPADKAIDVEIDGGILKDKRGMSIDGDANGTPGGVGRISYHTLSLESAPGTSVSGRVFATERIPATTAGGLPTNYPLEGVRIFLEGREDEVFTYTDAGGNFRLEEVPAGDFFVYIDGRGVPQTPDGTPTRYSAGPYYPFVGKKWSAPAGEESSVGTIYLPLIAAGTLNVVSSSAPSRVDLPASVLAGHPEYSGVHLVVPPNSLYADDGVVGGRVGIAPVTPDRLPSPLPPGINFPIVLTVQTDGPSNFDQPVPVCFPNLPDRESGFKLAPGSKSTLWSFDHDIGDWVIIGPMTVSEDGNTVCSDPGVGIMEPGWHGSDPRNRGDGGRRRRGCGVVISGPTVASYDTPVSFQAYGATPGGTFIWSATNASPSGVAGIPNFSTRFQAVGDQSVEVSYTTANSQTCTADLDVTVEPKVTISGPTDWEKNRDAVYTADGKPTGGTYRWEVLGAGHTISAHGPQATVAFTSNGSYSVKVFYTLPDSPREVSYTRTVQVGDQCVSLQAPATTEYDKTTIFTAVPGTPGGTFAWEFEDGNPATATTPIVSVKFTACGPKRVKLTYRTPGGRECIENATVEVEPSIEITGPASALIGEENTWQIVVKPAGGDLQWGVRARECGSGFCQTGTQPGPVTQRFALSGNKTISATYLVGNSSADKDKTINVRNEIILSRPGLVGGMVSAGAGVSVDFSASLRSQEFGDWKWTVPAGVDCSVPDRANTGITFPSTGAFTVKVEFKGSAPGSQTVSLAIPVKIDCLVEFDRSPNLDEITTTGSPLSYHVKPGSGPKVRWSAPFSTPSSAELPAGETFTTSRSDAGPVKVIAEAINNDGTACGAVERRFWHGPLPECTLTFVGRTDVEMGEFATYVVHGPANVRPSLLTFAADGPGFSTRGFLTEDYRRDGTVVKPWYFPVAGTARFTLLLEYSSMYGPDGLVYNTASPVDCSTELTVNIEDPAATKAANAPDLLELQLRDGQHFYAIEDTATGEFIERGLGGGAGVTFPSISLAPNARYRSWVVQGATLAAGVATFTSEDSGTTFHIPDIPISESFAQGADSDGDEMSDLAEKILGLDPNNPDSDGDGIPDGPGVRGGAIPRPSAQLPVVYTRQDPPARGSYDIATGDNLAFVAGPQGVQVYNITGDQEPALVSTLFAEFTAQSVAYQDHWVVAALGQAGIGIADVRNPARPQSVRTVNTLSACTSVQVGMGQAFGGSAEGRIQAFDLVSGTLSDTIELVGNINDMAISGGYLYAVNSNSSGVGIEVLDFEVSTGRLEHVGTAITGVLPVRAMPQRNRLSGGGDYLFLSSMDGYDVLSLANPRAPAVVQHYASTALGWKHVVYDGNSRLFAAAGLNTTPDAPQEIWYHSVTSAVAEPRLLQMLATGGAARALAMDHGRLFCVDDSVGLTGIRYLEPDRRGSAPVISLRTNWPGRNASIGDLLEVTADATDDVLVRNVEFYLNDEPVSNDGGWPFSWRSLVPAEGPLRLRARAFDMGGNATWSNEVPLTPVADASPIRVVRTSPNGSIGSGDFGPVLVTFSEPADPATITAESIRLLGPGPDRIPANDDDTSVSAVVALEAGGTTATLTIAPLPSGFYRVLVSTDVKDVAGNALAAPVANSFIIEGLRITDFTPESGAVVDATIPAGTTEKSAAPLLLASVTFNRDIDEASVDPGDLQVVNAGPDDEFDTADDVQVEASQVMLTEPAVLGFVDYERFPRGRLRATLGTGIRDVHGGELLSGLSWEFIASPLVKETYPANRETVTSDSVTTVSISFNVDMDPESLCSKCYSIYQFGFDNKEAASPQPTRVDYDEQTDTFNFIFADPLPEGDYTFEIAGSVRTANGVTYLEGGYRWDFRIIDPMTLTVRAVNTGYSMTQPLLAVRFAVNKPLDPSSLAAETLSFTPFNPKDAVPKGAPIHPASLTFDESAMELVASLPDSLPSDYWQGVLTPGIRGTDGSFLRRDYRFNFSIEQPSTSGVSPRAGTFPEASAPSAFAIGFTTEMDPDTLTSDHVALVEAGPDGNFGPRFSASDSDDVIVPNVTNSYAVEDAFGTGRLTPTLRLTAAEPLPAGVYSVREVGNITDAWGSSFDGARLSQRWLVTTTGTATWSNQAGGSWLDAANWQGNARPRPGQDIVIDTDATVDIALTYARLFANSITIGDTAGPGNPALVWDGVVVTDDAGPSRITINTGAVLRVRKTVYDANNTLEASSIEPPITNHGTLYLGEPNLGSLCPWLFSDMTNDGSIHVEGSTSGSQPGFTHYRVVNLVGGEFYVSQPTRFGVDNHGLTHLSVTNSNPGVIGAYGWSGAGEVTNRPGATISVDASTYTEGNSRPIQGPLFNEGSVVLKGHPGLGFYMDSLVRQSGDIKVEQGAFNLTLNSETESPTTGSFTTAESGFADFSFTGAISAPIFAGPIQGVGEFNFLKDIIVAGTLKPAGDEIGTIRLRGIAQFAASSALAIQIGNDGSDLLEISEGGTINLPAKLVVQPATDFNPPVGTRTSILQGGYRLQFTSVAVEPPLPEGKSYDVIYGSNDISIEVQPGS